MARRGDIDGAVREFTEARMARSPVALSAPAVAAPADHFKLASQLQAGGDLAGAERELDADLRLNPSDGRALYSRGLLEAQTGHVAEGAAEVEKGLSLMRRPTTRGYATLADIYDLQGDEARHAEVLKKIESMPDGDQFAFMARARAMIGHGDLAGAERELYAHPTVPGSWYLWDALGEVRAQAGQKQEALLSFRRALEWSILRDKPGNRALYLRIAEMLHAMGRDREAFDQCRLVLALDPRNQTAQALKAELQNKLAARVPHL